MTDNWQSRGNCCGMDPNIFYPVRGGTNQHSDPARAICATCPVKGECLEYAIHNEFVGIWGGTSEKQRRQIRRDRGIKLQVAQCGTRSGYGAQRDRNEPACDACRAALAAHSRKERDGHGRGWRAADWADETIRRERQRTA